MSDDFFRELYGPVIFRYTDAQAIADGILECPRCLGQMKIVAAIDSPSAIRKILEYLGLPSRGAPLAPARSKHPEWF